jgi:hypothetical protein
MRVMIEHSPTTDMTDPTKDNPLTMKRERKVVANTDETPDKHRYSRGWKDEMPNKNSNSYSNRQTQILLTGIGNELPKVSGTKGFDHQGRPLRIGIRLFIYFKRQLPVQSCAPITDGKFAEERILEVLILPATNTGTAAHQTPLIKLEKYGLKCTPKNISTDAKTTQNPPARRRRNTCCLWGLSPIQQKLYPEESSVRGSGSALCGSLRNKSEARSESRGSRLTTS